MQLRLFILSTAFAAGVATSAYALTLDEIKAKLQAAGYSQIRQDGQDRPDWSRMTQTGSQGRS